MSIYNQKPNKRNINKYLKSLQCFRGSKEDLKSELKKFFKEDIFLHNSNYSIIILDDYFTFTYKKGILQCNVSLYFIKDLQSNYYITEFETELTMCR